MSEFGDSALSLQLCLSLALFQVMGWWVQPSRCDVAGAFYLAHPGLKCLKWPLKTFMFRTLGLGGAWPKPWQGARFFHYAPNIQSLGSVVSCVLTTSSGVRSKANTTYTGQCSTVSHSSETFRNKSRFLGLHLLADSNRRQKPRTLVACGLWRTLTMEFGWCVEWASKFVGARQ